MNQQWKARRTALRKEAFLKMARRGGPRPSQVVSHSEYALFRTYMKTDSAFREEVLRLQPSWDVRTANPSCKPYDPKSLFRLIKRFTEMASSPDPIVRIETEDYKRLSYIKKRKPEIWQRLVDLRPEWSRTASCAKKEIIKVLTHNLVPSAKLDPKAAQRYRQRIFRYIRPASPLYDEMFAAEVRRLRAINRQKRKEETNRVRTS